MLFSYLTTTIMVLLAPMAEGLLGPNEVFKWTSLWNCLDSEGWQLAAPANGATPTPMVEPAELGGAPYCSFDGAAQYIPIDMTTGDKKKKAEQQSVVRRTQFTISVLFRSRMTTSPTANVFDRVGFLDCHREMKCVMCLVVRARSEAGCCARGHAVAPSPP